MAFRISEFKSNFERFGGAARGNLFQVIVTGYPSVNSIISGREFSFFCQSATIPAVNLNTTTYEAVGQLPKVFPVGVQAEQLDTIFLVDSDHEILKFFHAWIQNVINIGTTGGAFSQVNGKLPFEIGFKEEYSCRLTVRHYSTESDPSKYYEVILDKAFPVAVGNLELSWEQNDSFLTLPVAFAYDRIEYSGLKTGSPTSRLGRGNGFFDILGAVAGFAGVLQQTVEQGTSGINTIQDAVNRVQRVTNSFGNITRTLGI